MSKQILWLAGAAWLFAGAAQAESTEALATQARSALAQKEAPAPTAGIVTAEAPGKKAAERELHPDAKPVYLDGGHFGGN